MAWCASDRSALILHQCGDGHSGRRCHVDTVVFKASWTGRWIQTSFSDVHNGESVNEPDTTIPVGMLIIASGSPWQAGVSNPTGVSRQ